MLVIVCERPIHVGHREVVAVRDGLRVETASLDALGDEGNSDASASYPGFTTENVLVSNNPTCLLGHYPGVILPMIRVERLGFRVFQSDDPT